MSKENPTITLEELNEIKYHELKDKFEELGVGDVWKPGTKKDELIQKALERIAVIKTIEGNDDLTDEEKQEKINEAEVNKAKALEADAKKAKVQTQEAQSDIQTAIEKQNFSKEVLEHNLKSIQASLNNAPSKEQRSILLSKQKAITAILNKK